MKRNDFFYIFAVVIPSSLSVFGLNRLVWLPLFIISIYTFIINHINNSNEKYSFYIFILFLSSITFILNIFIGRHIFIEEFLIIILSISLGYYFFNSSVNIRLQEINLLLIFFAQILILFTGIDFSSHWAPWMFLLYSSVYFSTPNNKVYFLKGFIILLLGLIMAALSDSRSSILIFLMLIIAYCFYELFKKIQLEIILKSFSVLAPVILFITFINLPIIIESISELKFFENSALNTRGASLGPRQIIYNCYITNFEYIWLLIGVNISDLWNSCGIFFDSIEIGKSETSIINIISFLGIFGVLLTLFLLFKSFQNIHNHFCALIFLATLLRAFTGDFLIGTVHDWVFFYFIFFYMRRNKDAFQ